MILHCIVTTQHLDTDTVYQLYRTSLQFSAFITQILRNYFSIGQLKYKYIHKLLLRYTKYYEGIGYQYPLFKSNLDILWGIVLLLLLSNLVCNLNYFQYLINYI